MWQHSPNKASIKPPAPAATMSPNRTAATEIAIADPIVQGATRQRYRGQRPLAGCNHETSARKMHTHLAHHGIATLDYDLMDGRGD
jgi:hypothetical protein